MCWVSPYRRFVYFRILTASRYCFGAPYVCNELAGDTVTAGAFAHPAFLKEHHFKNLKSMSSANANHISSPGGIEPLFLSCAENDHTFDTTSRRRATDILHESKKPYNVQLFSSVEHGFALRGNMENPYESESLYQATRLHSTN